MPFTADQYIHLNGYSCVPETEFVLGAIEHKLSPQIQPPEISSCDTIRLFELARLNKLLNFMPRSLQSGAADQSSFSKSLDQTRLQTMALNSRGLREASAVTALLNSADIPHMHFKGPLQQIAFYDDPYSKPSGDIDILVAPTDRRKATEVMLSADYTVFDAPLSGWWWRFLGELHLHNPNNGMTVDLHHGLQQAGLPRPLNNNDFLTRRTKVEHNGTTFEVPSPADSAIITAISIAKALRAHEPCLGNVVDMRAAMARLSPHDCKVLRSAVAQSGMEHTLALGMRCVHAVFPKVQERGDLAEITEEVFTELSNKHIRQMVITPWLDTIPWPRNRRFILELSGGRIMRTAKEGVRLVLSEGTRKLLGAASQTKSIMP